MRRMFVLLACCVAGPLLNAQLRPGGSYHDLGDSERVASFKDHISYIASPTMEGRAPGSEGERETAAYVAGVLEDYGVDVISGYEGEKFGMRQESGDTLTSCNVIGFIQGYDKTLRERYIVIGARMDNVGSYPVTVNGEVRKTVCYGADGNASGVAMLLELARMLQTNSILLRRSVLLVGFGASTRGFAGSWYFLNRSFRDVDHIDAMIDLDVLGTASNGFYAYTASNPDLNRLVEERNNMLQPIVPTLTAREPFGSDYRNFYDHKIPSVLLTTGWISTLGTERDTPDTIGYEDMERELEYIYSFSVALANGPAPVFDPEAVRRSDRSVEEEILGYQECDYPPTFLNSSNPSTFMEKWVYAYRKYPEEAVRNGIQGKVLVAFVIDEKGKVRSVRVLKGVDPLLDEEAVRVIAASPDWKPGRKNGKKVKCEMSVYVEFRLTKKGSFGVKK